MMYFSDDYPKTPAKGTGNGKEEEEVFLTSCAWFHRTRSMHHLAIISFH